MLCHGFGHDDKEVKNKDQPEADANAYGGFLTVGSCRERGAQQDEDETGEGHDDAFVEFDGKNGALAVPFIVG